MTPEEINNLPEPMVRWLEESVQTLCKIKPVSCAFVGRAPDGTAFTGYWGATTEGKAMLAYSILQDVVIDTIANNREYIQHAWEEQENQEEAEA